MQTDKCLFIRVLESMISKLATSKISFFYLVYVVEETGLSIALLETPKTGFVVSVDSPLRTGYGYGSKISAIFM